MIENKIVPSELIEARFIGLDDDFTKSLEKQYELYNKLTNKQLLVMKSKIDKYKKIKKLFEECEKDQDLIEKAFYKSLKQQFADKKFLSDKQIAILERMSSS